CVQSWAQSVVYTLEELECKICYNRYDTRSRKPKLLGCLHRVCAKCLKKMADMGESSPSVISCPFCRHETPVPEEEVTLPPDDRHILAVLSYQDRARRGGGGGGGEVVLSPSGLTGESPSVCVRLCSGGVGEAVHPSAGRREAVRPAQCVRVTSCVFVCVCAQVYFSSLPLGIYLLMIGQLWLGVLLVSLVPSTLLLLVLYGFCQCLCHELREVLVARTHRLP
uniref:E3 ubiquitin-protein ligase RNF182 n=1 Tax=Salarias fasciatus TaxID=181472 RepID=A0A672FUV9_SALFA